MAIEFKHHSWVDPETERRLRAKYYIETPRTNELLDEAADLVKQANDSMIVVDEPADVPIGCMVAFFVETDLALDLALPGGEDPENLHVTLAYLPAVPPGDEVNRLVDVVRGFALTCAPVEGEISGFGIFTAGPEPVTYASVDVPDLPELRQRLVETLDEAGFDVACTHGYTPHITLAYDDRRNAPVDNARLRFAALSVAAGPGQRWDVPMSAPVDDVDLVEEAVEGSAEANPAKIAEDELIKRNSTTDHAKMPHQFAEAHFRNDGGDPRCLTCGGEQPDGGVCAGTAADPEGNGLTQDDLSQAPMPRAAARLKPASAAPGEPTRAFVTEAHGKLLITAQASALDPEWSTAANPNPYMLWMNGRFVGGEKANRNGAFWSTADLSMGQPTVQHGPLNWLHESRHVIGTIAKARLHTYDNMRDQALDEPYIEALSGIWRWIYSEEAAVVEMASEQQKLWYSMECVSRSVRCIGDNGCGAEAAYMDYIHGRGDTCPHMRQHSAVRQLVDPTFLGGAVIVPPARPGWGGADASVLAEATRLAEVAFDQAGQPDMTTTEWELLMAQVVSFARG